MEYAAKVTDKSFLANSYNSLAWKMAGEGNNYIINYKAQNNVLPALYWLRSQNPDAEIFILDSLFSTKDLKDTLATGSVFLRGLSSAQVETFFSKFKEVITYES